MNLISINGIYQYGNYVIFHKIQGPLKSYSAQVKGQKYIKGNIYIISHFFS